MCRLHAILFAVAFLSGCASAASSRAALEMEGVKSPAGVQLAAYEGNPPADLEGKVQSLLKSPLTIDGAIQIAVLNNRRFQATLQELGIAKGDLIQLALPRNPEISGSIGFPVSGNAQSHITADLTQDVTSLLLRSKRKKIGNFQYQGAAARVSSNLLSLAMEVKSSYYELQSLMQTQAMLQGVVEASEASLELSERQRKAGTIGDLEYANQHALFDQAKLDLLQTESSIQNERERLNRLLGVNGNTWTLEPELPEPPMDDLFYEETEKLALSQRMDLSAARSSVQALEESLTLSKLAALPSLEVGAEVERNEEGAKEVGPVVKMGIPIFNRNQGAIVRAKSELAQSQHLTAALESEIRSEVRSTLNRMISARKTASYYHDTIIPVRTQIVDESQKHYNFMLVGVYQLVQARQNEIAARRAYIDSVKNYWVARSELERAVGGKLPDSFTAPMHHSGGH